MASRWYDNALELLLKGELDMADDDLEILIVTTGYTYATTHEDVNDLTPGSNEAAVSGYSRKDTDITVAEDNSIPGAWVKIEASGGGDIEYTSVAAGETWGAAILFKNSGSDATSPLIAYLDIANTVTNGSDITLDFASSSPGNLKLTNATS